MKCSTRKVIITIALVAAAIGPVLIVVGKVISSIGIIMTLVPKLAGVINTSYGSLWEVSFTLKEF